MYCGCLRSLFAFLAIFLAPLLCVAQQPSEPDLYEWGTDVSKVDQSANSTCAALSLDERKLYPRSCGELNYALCTDGKSVRLGKTASWGDAIKNCAATDSKLAFPSPQQGIFMPRLMLESRFAWVNFKKFSDDQRHRDPADRRGEHWMSASATAIQAFAPIPAVDGSCGALFASGPAAANCSTSLHELCVRESDSGVRTWDVTSGRSVYFSASNCSSLGAGFRRGVPVDATELVAVTKLVTARNLVPAWLGLHVQDRVRRCVSPETFVLCTAVWATGTLFWASQVLPGNDADKLPVVQISRPAAASALPWHIAAINLTRQVSVSPSVAIGVLDSGIDFSGGLSTSKARAFNYTAEPVGVSASSNEAIRVHGTVMASIIAAPYTTVQGKAVMGIAPGVKIVDRKITPNPIEREVGVKALSSAIEDASADRPDQNWPSEPILNVSFAYQGIMGVHLEELRNRLIAVGKSNKTLIVAAVGNDGAQISSLDLPYWNWPAAYKPTKKFAIDTDPVIRVAALQQYTRGQTPALYSNSRRGAGRVDIAAPGVGIPSYGPEGQYYGASGSSQAAAIVSGVLALMKSCAPAATASELKALLLSNSDRYPTLENDVSEGRVINADRAIEAACARLPDSSLYMK